MRMLVYIFTTCLFCFIRHTVQVASPNEGSFSVNFLFPARLPYKGPGDQCCGGLFQSQAITVTQFQRTIEDINNAVPPLLPCGFKIGYEAADSCASENFAVSQILDWLQRRKVRSSANHPLAFVIGAGFSRIAQKVVPIFSSFGIPMVDYSATSPALSDRSEYKLYARVSPSDAFLAKAMVDVIKKFNWKCVHLLYSHGAYGESGAESVAQYLLNSSICIVGEKPIALSLDDNATATFDSALSKMLRFDNVRPVICFCEWTSIQGLLTAISSRNSANMRQNRPKIRFFLIAGDFWGSQLELPNLQDAAENSITFGYNSVVPKLLSGHPVRDVKAWAIQKIISGELTANTNPWLNDFLEIQSTPCTINRSSTNKYCDAETLSRIEFPLSNSLTTLSGAIFAGVHGIKSYLEEQARLNASNICNVRLLNNGSALYEHIRRASFELADGKTFKFHDEGDGYPRYKIYRYVKKSFGGTSYSYESIAEWDVADKTSLSNLTDRFLSFYQSTNDDSCPLNQICKANCSPSRIVSTSAYTDESPVVPCYEEEEAAAEDKIVSSIVFPIVTTFLALIITALIILLILCRRKRCKNEDCVNYARTREELYLENLLANPELNFSDKERQELRSLFRSAAIDSTQIALMNSELVGKGSKGVVNRGFYHTPKGLEVIAIKSLRNETPSEAADLIRESAIMHSFSHPNILKLIGITISPTDSLNIITPFMPDGDLRNFLVKHGSSLTEDDRLKFVIQICSAMTYLSSRSCIHRDLACRNILIEVLPYLTLLKLCDFGLTRHLDEAEYYKPIDRNRAIPIRWWPPEALHDGYVFEERSDVWSFGIVCWEIFTNGERPYDDRMNQEVLQFVINGGHPEQPENCSTEIYLNLMKRCWIPYRLGRPRFNSLLESLRLDREFRSSNRFSNNSSSVDSGTANGYLQTSTPTQQNGGGFTNIKTISNGIQL